MTRSRMALCGALSAALLTAASSAHALRGEVVATGLNQPLFVTAPLGDERLFMVEKGGLIRVMRNGALQAAPFLDISTKVGTEGERGLLGLAFDPAFASNGRFYVDYIDKATGNTMVDRYTLPQPGNNVADPLAIKNLVSIQQTTFTNHKGGWIGFRPGDASQLYIATGDGGGGNDPFNNAQNPDSMLGKLLRVNVNQTVTTPEIWASGVRNPWRNSFDRQTGDLWIGDVGQDTREEIDFERAGTPGGRNYGWRVREGSVATPGIGDTGSGFTEPVFDYAHLGQPGGLGNSIVGGYVYRGPSLPEADGRYFFGDFVSNRVFSLRPDASGHATDLREETAALLDGTGLSGLDSFGEDGQGRLYLVGINGTVVRMVPEPGAWLMALGGLLTVGAATRRQRQSAHTSASAPAKAGRELPGNRPR